eukprot:521978_1
MGNCTTVPKKSNCNSYITQVKSKHNEFDWIYVDALPNVSCFAVLNDHELIGCANRFNFNDQKICTYNSLSNKWKLMHKKYNQPVWMYDSDYSDLTCITINAATCNKIKRWLYLYSSHKLFVHNFMSGISREYLSASSSNFNYTFKLLSMICANNQLHLIGKYNSENAVKHLAWNVKTLGYDCLHAFEEWTAQNIETVGLVHHKCRNRLILFGGLDTYLNQSFDSIFICNLNQKMWYISEKKLHLFDKKTLRFGYTLVECLLCYCTLFHNPNYNLYS